MDSNIDSTLILLVLFVGFGAASGGMYYLQIHQPQQTIAEAEPVSGTIISTSIQEGVKDQETVYTPQIKYRYTYEGTEFTGTNIKPGLGSETDDYKPAVKKLVNKYEEGEEVTVYVNPNNPTKSFLIKDGPGTFTYVFIGLFGLVAVFMFILVINSVWTVPV